MTINKLIQFKVKDIKIQTSSSINSILLFDSIKYLENDLKLKLVNFVIIMMSFLHWFLGWGGYFLYGLFQNPPSSSGTYVFL